jgi:hypothetical protein
VRKLVRHRCERHRPVVDDHRHLNYRIIRNPEQGGGASFSVPRAFELQACAGSFPKVEGTSGLNQNPR